MIKVIFFDLDGTLLDCAGGKDRLSDRDLKVFDRLKREGIRIFAATGRSVSFIPPFLRTAGSDGFVLVNGADVWVGEEEIARHPLPRRQVETITKRLEEEGIEYALQIPGGTWMSRKRGDILPYFRTYLFDEGYLTKQDRSLCVGETMKLELYVYPEKLPVCREIVKGLKNTWEPATNAMEVYSRRVSKATGAMAALACLGVKPEESMCFGDDSNDLELFRMAGWSVAMENGIGAVKQQADDICQGAVLDGPARYLEKALASGTMVPGLGNRDL